MVNKRAEKKILLPELLFKYPSALLWVEIEHLSAMKSVRVAYIPGEGFWQINGVCFRKILAVYHDGNVDYLPRDKFFAILCSILPMSRIIILYITAYLMIREDAHPIL